MFQCPLARYGFLRIMDGVWYKDIRSMCPEICFCQIGKACILHVISQCVLVYLQGNISGSEIFVSLYCYLTVTVNEAKHA